MQRTRAARRIPHLEAPVFASDLLKDKVFVVTGGGSGLGAEMARRFAALGAHSVVLGRRLDRLQKVVDEIVQAGGKALALACDVRDFPAVQAVADGVDQQLGRIDGLVNNAAGNFLAASEDLSPNGFKTVVDIVLNGTFNCTSAFGKKMIARGKGGAVVNIVATYAWTGSAFVLPSACAKAGVLALTRSLAVEWAHYGIRLNAIAPGPVPTDGAFSRLMPDPSFEEMAKNRVPLKRFGTPREIADAAVFLLCDGAGYVTGDCLTVDGGEWLKNGGEFSYATDYDRENLKAMLKAMRGKEK
jgi:NAD(P)-dependent dehydrogenase (short-subunit alcohol dehydrogenase family)